MFQNYKCLQRNLIASMEPGEPIIYEVEIPRKITLFRVLVERKLGIDFEHPENNERPDDFESSLGTNQVVPGY
jgi:hypothetical protein